MPTEEEIAIGLVYEFLRRGNYSAAAGPVRLPEVAAGVAPAAVLGRKEEFFEATEGFGSVSIQSVGCEDGVDDPSVRIYLRRGSLRQIRSLSEEIEGIPIVAQRMGPVSVKPETASSTTNRAHLFERNGRLCCGSSCAPTSENCSETLGALVRKEGSLQIYLLSNNHVFGGGNMFRRISRSSRPAATTAVRTYALRPRSAGRPQSTN
jgi:hypothetical protein